MQKQSKQGKGSFLVFISCDAHSGNNTKRQNTTKNTWKSEQRRLFIPEILAQVTQKYSARLGTNNFLSAKLHPPTTGRMQIANVTAWLRVASFMFASCHIWPFQSGRCIL